MKPIYQVDDIVRVDHVTESARIIGIKGSEYIIVIPERTVTVWRNQIQYLIYRDGLAPSREGDNGPK